MELYKIINVYNKTRVLKEPVLLLLHPVYSQFNLSNFQAAFCTYFVFWDLKEIYLST